MKTLHFVKANNLSALHDEILAAIPSLAPVRDSEGKGTPVMRVEGNASDIWLTVPSDANEAAIEAIIGAHDGTLPQPDPSAERKTRIVELLQTGRGNWTTAQLREIIELAAREVTG